MLKILFFLVLSPLTLSLPADPTKADYYKLSIYNDKLSFDNAKLQQEVKELRQALQNKQENRQDVNLTAVVVENIYSRMEMLEHRYTNLSMQVYLNAWMMICALIYAMMLAIPKMMQRHRKFWNRVQQRRAEDKGLPSWRIMMQVRKELINEPLA